MFAELMAESQRKTSLAERQRKYMRMQREKEMQISQDIVTLAKDGIAVVRNSIAIAEATQGRFPEPECSPSKHAPVMPEVPCFGSQPHPSAPGQHWLLDQQELLSPVPHSSATNGTSPLRINLLAPGTPALAAHPTILTRGSRGKMDTHL